MADPVVHKATAGSTDNGGRFRRLVVLCDGHKVVHSPHSFEPMMSGAHVISTLGGTMRDGADPRGGAGVGYAW
ncbi:MAG: Gamma-glutamyltransferase [Betaproteobacteria bacterium]|nr:Gamma-glutamyltransferase [Betaproteobacteria bacterium]